MVSSRSARCGSGRWFGGQEVFGADRVDRGEFGQGGQGHRPVGAFVGAQDIRRPAPSGSLVNLLEGHAVLLSVGAQSSAERDRVLA